jgi:hypothetical protein
MLQKMHVRTFMFVNFLAHEKNFAGSSESLFGQSLSFLQLAELASLQQLAERAKLRWRS